MKVRVLSIYFVSFWIRLPKDTSLTCRLDWMVLPPTVTELCGGDLEDLSSLELLKRDDLQFQVVDEAELDDDDIEILDELGEFEIDDDDDDDYYT